MVMSFGRAKPPRSDKRGVVAKKELRVDYNSKAYKEIMEVAEGATIENGISTRGMSDDEILALIFKK